MLFAEHFATRSQDLPRALHDAGQFYWGRPQAWLSAETLFGPRSYPLLVPRWRVQDIDTPDDWKRAEALFRALRG
jgi:N-acylneuraminate cytidylyltransferase